MISNLCSDTCGILIRQGDQYKLPVSIKIDGNNVTPALVSNIIGYLGNIEKSYINNQITFENDTWYFPLLSEETLSMCGKYEFQFVLILQSGDHLVTPIRFITVEHSKANI